MNETFLLTNIAPQVGAGFNRHCTSHLTLLLHPIDRLNSTWTIDWAYLEDWCRKLTNSFSDVYVFTVPLYLPRLDSDGKSRVVCPSFPSRLHLFGLFFWLRLTLCSLSQTYEMIGNPPNIAVPTHFAKVVLTTKPISPSNPDILDLSMGAFVLPNAIIPDEAPLESFSVPGTFSFIVFYLVSYVFTNTPSSPAS